MNESAATGMSSHSGSRFKRSGRSSRLSGSRQSSRSFQHSLSPSAEDEEETEISLKQDPPRSVLLSMTAGPRDGHFRPTTQRQDSISMESLCLQSPHRRPTKSTRNSNGSLYDDLVAGFAEEDSRAWGGYSSITLGSCLLDDVHSIHHPNPIRPGHRALNNSRFSAQDIEEEGSEEMRNYPELGEDSKRGLLPPLVFGQKPLTLPVRQKSDSGHYRRDDDGSSSVGSYPGRMAAIVMDGIVEGSSRMMSFSSNQSSEVAPHMPTRQASIASNICGGGGGGSIASYGDGEDDQTEATSSFTLKG